MPAPSDAVTWTGPHDDEFRWIITVYDPIDPSVRDGLRAAMGEIRRAGAGTTQLWMCDLDLDVDVTTSTASDLADDIATDFGFVAYRDLWRLEVPLPISATTDLSTRSIRPADQEAVIEVNRRAFAWHPEQGVMDADNFAERTEESWYDPDGFLLHERDGRIAGFNWTKPHRDVDPPIGEIYVIATDPDFQGLGIGRGLAIAGLAYLADQGFDGAMLYVESDNDGANHLYFDLGFKLNSINRAYRQDLVPEAST